VTLRVYREDTTLSNCCLGVLDGVWRRSAGDLLESAAGRVKHRPLKARRFHLVLTSLEHVLEIGRLIRDIEPGRDRSTSQRVESLFADGANQVSWAFLGHHKLAIPAVSAALLPRSRETSFLYQGCANGRDKSTEIVFSIIMTSIVSVARGCVLELRVHLGGVRGRLRYMGQEVVRPVVMTIEGILLWSEHSCRSSETDLIS